MEETESTTEKPQAGAWDEAKGYPQKITFELNKPVKVTFAEDFDKPIEMPSQDGNGVYYIFNCQRNGGNASIATSAWTLLNSLKGQSPLAGKTLIITKKNVKGKNMYYVTTPEAFGAPEVEEPTEEVEVTGVEEEII